MRVIAVVLALLCWAWLGTEAWAQQPASADTLQATPAQPADGDTTQLDWEIGVVDSNYVPGPDPIQVQPQDPIPSKPEIRLPVNTGTVPDSARADSVAPKMSAQDSAMRNMLLQKVDTLYEVQLLRLPGVSSPSRRLEGLAHSAITLDSWRRDGLSPHALPATMGTLWQPVGAYTQSLQPNLNYWQGPTLRGYGTPSTGLFVDGTEWNQPGAGPAQATTAALPWAAILAAEWTEGPHSALMGSGAWNGMLNLRLARPFEYSGIRLYAQTGVTGLDATSLNPKAAYHYSFSWNEAVAKDKVALELALDYRAQEATTAQNWQRGGNEVPLYSAALQQTVYRTGYDWNALNPSRQSMATGLLGVHFALPKGYKIGYRLHWQMAQLPGIQQAGLVQQQAHSLRHVLMAEGKHWYIRFVATHNQANGNYNSAALAYNLQNNFLSDSTWLARYTQATLDPSLSSDPRAFADLGRLLPGDEEWNRQRSQLLSNPQQSGGVLQPDNSRHWQLEGQYDLKGMVRFVDMLVGLSLSVDENRQPLIFKPLGWSTFAPPVVRASGWVGLARNFLRQRLRWYGHTRYDHLVDFAGRFSAQSGFIISPVRGHSIRLGYQLAYRLPSTAEWVGSSWNGAAYTLGAHPALLAASGLDNFVAFTAASAQRMADTLAQANFRNEQLDRVAEKNLDLLQVFRPDTLKPERIHAAELAYNWTGNQRFWLQAAYRFSYITDAIVPQQLVLTESTRINDPSYQRAAINLNPSLPIYSRIVLPVNYTQPIYLHHFNFGFRYTHPRWFGLGLQYAYTRSFPGTTTADVYHAQAPMIAGGQHMAGGYVHLHKLVGGLGAQAQAQYIQGGGWPSSTGVLKLQDVVRLQAELLYQFEKQGLLLRLGGQNVLTQGGADTPLASGPRSFYYFTLEWQGMLPRKKKPEAGNDVVPVIEEAK